MNILFIHQNFPAQFKFLAPALARRGHTVLALCVNEAPAVEGVSIYRYKIERGSSKDIHPWASEFETKVLRGEACGRAAMVLQARGFTPDLICAHPGWGELLFLKDVWPSVRILGYWEFYYASRDSDVDFDPEFHKPSFENMARLRTKNANNLLALEICDWNLTPTAWQQRQFSPMWRDKMSVIHDGIDTKVVVPDPEVRVTLPALGLEFKPGDEIITFVNRNLEPYRGYHIFMRALPALLRQRPKARVLIIGGDGVSYGAKAPEGTSWKQLLLDELGSELDLSRIHFLGQVPYASYLRVLQVSAVHVYLTYPFILSWSLLEAMSAGCLVVGSRTGPVEEVIRHGENGLLVDFFDHAALAETLAQVLATPETYAALRGRARETVVAGYDLATHCLPRQVELVERLLSLSIASDPRRASPTPTSPPA